MYEKYLKDEEALAWTLVETMKARVKGLKARGVVGVEVDAASGAPVGVVEGGLV